MMRPKLKFSPGSPRRARNCGTSSIGRAMRRCRNSSRDAASLELRHLLDRTRDAADADGSTAGDRPEPGGFPRSRTVQMLMSGRGLGTLGAAAAGLLIARPGLALRLLRILPASTIAKTLLMRTIAALRTKPERTPR